MAAGAPVVATAVGGIPSLVEDRVNGLLVPPGDAEALAGAIREVLTRPELAASLAAAGRSVAIGHDLEALADRTMDVYATVHPTDRIPTPSLHRGGLRWTA
jgi:glycosyltransferase involved in cell wall biosynthesis